MLKIVNKRKNRKAIEVWNDSINLFRTLALKREEEFEQVNSEALETGQFKHVQFDRDAFINGLVANTKAFINYNPYSKLSCSVDELKSAYDGLYILSESYTFELLSDIPGFYIHKLGLQNALVSNIVDRIFKQLAASRITDDLQVWRIIFNNTYFKEDYDNFKGYSYTADDVYSYYKDIVDSYFKTTFKMYSYEELKNQLDELRQYKTEKKYVGKILEICEEEFKNKEKEHLAKIEEQSKVQELNVTEFEKILDKLVRQEEKNLESLKYYEIDLDNYKNGFRSEKNKHFYASFALKQYNHILTRIRIYKNSISNINYNNYEFVSDIPSRFLDDLLRGAYNLLDKIKESNIDPKLHEVLMVPFSEYVDEELSPIIINDLSQLQNDVSSFNKKFQKFEINKIISYFTEYFRDKYKELMNNSCINIKSLNNLNDLNRNYFLKMIYVKGIISYEEKGNVFNLEEMKNALVTLGLFENEKELFDMYNEELKIRVTHSQKLGG